MTAKAQQLRDTKPRLRTAVEVKRDELDAARAKQLRHSTAGRLRRLFHAFDSEEHEIEVYGAVKKHS